MNRTLEPAVRSSRGFRLASFTPARFHETVGLNLAGLAAILRWNAIQDIGFFRISSDLIPFASHPVCAGLSWWQSFAAELREIGTICRQHSFRISMHPDQFTLLNAHDPNIVRRSVDELLYHAQVLDGMELGADARIQIHVGGVYGDRDAALLRFEQVWRTLPEPVRRRLAVENDDHHYSLADCCRLHQTVGLPVIFDFFHHALLNHGEPLERAVAQAAATWQVDNGPLMADYSSQLPGGRRGAHAEHLDPADFAICLAAANLAFDLMLEIKDKECSALVAKRLSLGSARATQSSG